MKKIELEKYRQAAKELRRHLDTQQYRRLKPERAFIDWYVFSRFGKPSEIYILDGKKDGGIDAIILVNGTWFVIQSKYELVPRVSLPANLLSRTFTASAPDRVWVGDITFVPTREGWLHLAVLLDLYSRRVVGWAMSDLQNRQLALDALTMAIVHRQPQPGLIHHTDQGAQYACSAYRAVLVAHGMIPSMSRKGDCYDNAVAESFFSNLKNELTWHRRFQDRDEARAAIFDYIEVFYNRQRLHQTLDYVSPVRYEEQVVP